MTHLEEKDLLELKEEHISDRGTVLPAGTKALVVVPPQEDGSLVADFLNACGESWEVSHVQAQQLRLIYKARLKLYL